MPVYVFNCKKCNLEFERIKPVSQCNDPHNCPSCNESISRQFVAPISSVWKVDTGTYSNVDKFVGKRSEQNWEHIEKNNDVKSKVRKESGTFRLAKTEKNDYVPVKDENLLKTRREVMSKYRESLNNK